MPLVSVVIPTHNRADMLREALISVIAQTFREFEIVVVDDGSDDHTRDVAHTCSCEVRYIRHENQGRARTRNAGIQASRGSYISFLDDDDVWYPRKLELQVALLKRRVDVDLVYGSVYFARDGCRQLITDEPHDPGTLLEWLILGDGIPAGASTVMVRRETLHQSGLFDPALEPCEDMELWARIALCGGRFGCVREPVAEYRIHKSNSSHNKHLMHIGYIAALEKLFAAPETPASIKTRRRLHLSQQWLQFGNEHYMDSQLSEARAAWREALKLNPSVATPQFMFLIAKTLCGSWTLRWGRRVRRALVGVGSSES